MTDIEIKSLKVQYKLQGDIISDKNMIDYYIKDKSEKLLEMMRNAKRRNLNLTNKDPYLTGDETMELYDFVLAITKESYRTIHERVDTYKASIDRNTALLNALR